MTRFCIILGIVLMTLSAAANAADLTVEETAVGRWELAPETQFPAIEVDPDEFKWIARPIVVFADTELDPDYRRQMELLSARAQDLIDRDGVVIFDADPEEQSEWRRKLRPRGFMLAIVGKDGTVALRKPLPWDVREITAWIDKMPLRRQEMLDQRGVGLN